MALSARTQRWTVVLVDDDAAMRHMLSGLLESVGVFDVVGQAQDGLIAIEVVARLQPDLVLMDWRMPGLDGLSALPEVRRVAPDAIVVILTGSPSAEFASRAEAAGADRLYTKAPSLVQRLVGDLTELLQAR